MSRNRGLWVQGQTESHGPIEPMDTPQRPDRASQVLLVIVAIALAAMVLV